MDADIERLAEEDIKLDEVLFGDFQTATNYLNQDDSQFWRRAFTRSLIALLEGIVSRLSKHTVTFYDAVLGEDD